MLLIASVLSRRLLTSCDDLFGDAVAVFQGLADPKQYNYPGL